MCAHRSVVRNVFVEQVEATPSIRDADTGVRMFCRGCFFKSLQKTLEKRSVVVMSIIMRSRKCVSMQRRGVVVVVERGKGVSRSGTHASTTRKARVG